MEPLIIECALNEQVTKRENPMVPISADELVTDALAAAGAGAAILHFHARDGDALLHPGTAFYRDVMRRIRRENREVLLYPTYGASPTPRERFSHLEALAEDPEIRLDFATIDPGAVNLADLDPAGGGLGWDFVHSVSHAEAQHFLALAARHRMLFSFTVREPGHVRHALAYRSLGLAPDPLLFKVTMGEQAAWGLPPGPEALRILTEASVPSGVPYRYMTHVYGSRHAELCRYAVEHGGHVRTGVGDNPRFEGARLGNAEQVARVVAMAEAAGREVASPAETRRLLRALPKL